MKKQFVTIMLGAALTTAALLAPIPSEAKVISAQTPSGKTVQLRTMKIHGQTMVLVPMDMACDMFKFALCGASQQK
jgi:hypothetical protein